MSAPLSQQRERLPGLGHDLALQLFFARSRELECSAQWPSDFTGASRRAYCPRFIATGRFSVPRSAESGLQVRSSD